MSQASSNLLAWAGGLFDADGCLTMYWENHPKTAKHPYLKRTAVLDIRDEAAVDIFVHLFGGSKRLKKVSNVNHSDTFVWKASGAALNKFLMLISPYLILKSAQAKLMTASFKVRGKTTKPVTDQQQEALASFKEEMNELNRTGVGKPQVKVLLGQQHCQKGN